MNQIVVGSENKVKINAALRGFKRMFPTQSFMIDGISTNSGVSNQPLTDAETFSGARNRALAAQLARPQAKFWVGIEGGVESKGEELQCFAWVVIVTTDTQSSSKTATFILPPKISELVRQGRELGHADDLFFGRTNSKQENGSVGILTDNIITRTDYYEHALILALIPMLKPELYND